MKKIIYQLTIDDVQSVANQEIERELTKDEIEIIQDSIAKKIDWYSAIANAINEKIIKQEEQQ